MMHETWNIERLRMPALLAGMLFPTDLHVKARATLVGVREIEVKPQHHPSLISKSNSVTKSVGVIVGAVPEALVPAPDPYGDIVRPQRSALPRFDHVATDVYLQSVL